METNIRSELSLKRGITTHISEEAEFIPKLIRRDKEAYIILIKGKIQRKDITILNVYDLNVYVPDCIRQTLLELRLEIDPSTVILGDFNRPILPKGKLSGHKFSKDSLGLKNINQVNLTNVYRIFHPITAECTFFSAAHGTFFKRDHSLTTKQFLANTKNLI